MSETEKLPDVYESNSAPVREDVVIDGVNVEAVKQGRVQTLIRVGYHPYIPGLGVIEGPAPSADVRGERAAVRFTRVTYVRRRDLNFHDAWAQACQAPEALIGLLEAQGATVGPEQILTIVAVEYLGSIE